MSFKNACTVSAINFVNNIFLFYLFTFYIIPIRDMLKTYHLYFYFKVNKQNFTKIIYFCCIDYAKAFDCVDHKILRDENTRPSYLPPEKTVCRSRSQVRTRHGTTWFQIGKGVHQGCIIYTPLI